MSLDLSRSLSVKIINSDIKSGSGVIYKRSGFAYVITAKHCICPKVTSECKEKKRECNDCLLINSYAFKKTKISIKTPDRTPSISIKPQDIIAPKNKDIAIIVVKEGDLGKLDDLPELSIADYRYLLDEGIYVSNGYPSVTGTDESIPVIFDFCSLVGTELYLQISTNTIANLESAKYNMDAASGMGVFCNKTSKLAGIYVKTDDYSGSYSEYIDESVNSLLSESGYNILDISNEHESLKTLITDEFLSCFEKIDHSLSLGVDRNLDLYTVKFKGKSIDYEKLIERIYECLHLFCIPRKVIHDLKTAKKERKLHKNADEEFIKLKSDSKIFDLMLQGFLESEYGMPKLFTSMVGKQDTKSIHVNINDRSTHELVHSVSHFGDNINDVFIEVVDKLYKCACETESPTDLISSAIFDSTFSDEDKQFLVSILMPKEEKEVVEIIDSYAVLIGFNVNFSCVCGLVGYESYKKQVIDLIIKTVSDNIVSLIKSLTKVDAINTEVKLFFVPFENINSFKDEIIEGLR
ncbi:DUF1837 domain-containing protein [Vibrio splendidus]|uniref:Hachiman antiphage defense system protein HamA n=1 Tax=Vibrio splendidus TaxID=29497 RepID=UPI0024685E71|nr:Hachiman antiphage defense system protein HamA [Vibrio splendidus]MDH5904631.1 DUF1837 domain-containing protein [Vibrio splendidus]